MEYEERRRRKSSTVKAVWRVEVKSKQQIKENRKFYNRKHRGSYGNGGWCGKEKVMKQNEKLRGKKEIEKIFIENCLTKQEREIHKKLRTIVKVEKREGKEMKVGYRKITIEGVQWRWNEERGRLEVFQ
jgi:predicted metal-binding protein